jgi:methyl-accepting chemotaxis protein
MILLFMVSLLLLSISIYTTIYIVALMHSKEKLLTTSETYSRQINDWLFSHESTLTDMTKEIKRQSLLDKSSLSKYLNTQYRYSDTSVLDCFIGQIDKTFITGAKRSFPSSFDCTQSIWYKEALTKKGLVYSNPFFDENTQQVVITISEPLVVNEKIRGVVGVTISLNYISEFVNNIRLAPNSYGFLLDANKGFITHLKKDFSPISDQTSYMDVVFQGRYKPVADLMNQSSSFITSAKDFDAINKYFVLTAIDTANWHVGFAVPKRALTAPILSFLFLFMAVTLVCIFVCTLIILLIIHHFFKPLENLKDFLTDSFESKLERNTFHSFKDESQEIAFTIFTLKKYFHQTSSTLKQDIHLIHSLLTSTQKDLQQLNETLQQLSKVAAAMSFHASPVRTSSEDVTAVTSEDAILGNHSDAQTADLSVSILTTLESSELILQRLKYLQQICHRLSKRLDNLWTALGNTRF